MNSLKAVFRKQLLDTVKNKTVLIQYLMLPILTVVMESAVKLEDMPEHFFVKLFSVMFVGMAPLTCMAAIIAEEKEMNTLRALMMSGVKPWQYLLSTGTYVFLMCMVGTAVFAALGEYGDAALAEFLAAMAFGILLSEIAGAVIGIFGRNQMAATSLSIPVMMVFSFAPMLSLFNESVRKFARILYSQQISDWIGGIGVSGVSAGGIAVIAGNFTVGLALFALAYQKRGLE